MSNGNECFTDEACLDGGCVDACLVLQCPFGHLCLEAACVDACAEIECAMGQVCFEGDCVNDTCYATGCPNDDICLDGLCQANPCAGVDCPDGAYCRIEGDPPAARCIESCADVSCNADARCRDGQCARPLLNVTCPDSQACRDGVCRGECAGIICSRGLVCFAGQCIDDPCLHVTCPYGERCEVADGEALCVPDWSTEDDSMNGDGGMGPGAMTDAGVSTMDGGMGDGPSDSIDGGTTPMPILQDGLAPPPSRRDLGSGADGDSSASNGGCACDATGESPHGSWLLLAILIAGLRRHRRPSATER